MSSYPSCIRAANVSKDTTHREIIAVEGIDISTLKKQSINALYGPINAIEYCSTMFKFPTVYEMLNLIKPSISSEV